MNENTYIGCNSVEHVPPVPAWPPPWLSGPAVVTDIRNELSTVESSTGEPAESLAGPCPTCGCAIGWQLPAGHILCAACNPRPSDATKAVFVDDGRAWVDYAAERERHERRHEAADEPDDWNDGEPWTADTWHCPKCGSAASWESMADKLHCLTCEPPRRAERLQRFAASVRRRYPVGTVADETYPRDGE